MSRKRWNTGGSSGREFAVNTKFEEKGLDVRIDHRSYVRQGLDLIPTVHEG
ncbi:MAG: MobA/MobL family protein [Neglectibacter sp.]